MGTAVAATRGMENKPADGDRATEMTDAEMEVVSGGVPLTQVVEELAERVYDGIVQVADEMLRND
jgi:hypothetical protein